MPGAIAGHGAEIAYEQDPSGSPGVFTVVANLNGDITPPGLQRTAAEVTPHGSTIDEQITGVLRRTPMTFSVNYVFNNATHDHLTGMQKLIQDNTKAGFRVRGPSGSTDTDEVICSGYVVNFSETSPVQDGVRSADVEVVMDGPYIKDGVTIGTVG